MSDQPDEGRPLEGTEVLVFQHLAIEDPGSLASWMDRAGMRLTTVELDEGGEIPDLEGFDFLLVMGGPMDVWQEEEHRWLVTEKAAIRRWVRQLRRPYLGVCLGHQLLADALGGAVGLMATPEIGVMDIALTDDGRSDRAFAGLPPVVPALQWHGAEVR